MEHVDVVAHSMGGRYWTRFSRRSYLAQRWALALLSQGTDEFVLVFFPRNDQAPEPWPADGHWLANPFGLVLIMMSECVQRRLACSVRDSPTGEIVRAP